MLGTLSHLFGMVLLASPTALAVDQWTPCVVDMDCVEGDSCQYGYCVHDEASVEEIECLNMGDCDDGMHCVDGVCAELPQCPSGGVVTGPPSVSGANLPSSASCACHSDCEYNKKCVQGKCFSHRVIKKFQG